MILLHDTPYWSESFVCGLDTESTLYEIIICPLFEMGKNLVPFSVIKKHKTEDIW